MSYIDVTGKTEDEAIRKALEQLHMDRDDVSVEILERAKSGFLGIGSSPARVRVTYGQEEPETPAAPVQPERSRSPDPSPSRSSPSRSSPRPGSRSLPRLPSRLLSLPRLPRPPLPPRSSLSWTTTPGALPSS